MSDDNKNEPQPFSWGWFSPKKKKTETGDNTGGTDKPNKGFGNNTDAEAGMPVTTPAPTSGGSGKVGDGAHSPTANGGRENGTGGSGTPPVIVKGGETGATGKPEDKGGYKPWSEPEGPFRPHFFHPRADLLIQSPRVLISAAAYKRMLIYVETGRKEVGWLGTASRLPNGDFLIEDTFLLEQEVTAVETELSVEGQNKLVNELIEKGDTGIEQINKLRFWGHSHVRMGTSPSGTDESTMMRFAGEGLPWYVRGIFNKLGRAEFTIYLYDQGFRICDAPWAVVHDGKVIMDGNRHRFLNRWRSSGGDNRPYWQRNREEKPGDGRTTVDGKTWEQAYGSSKGIGNDDAAKPAIPSEPVKVEEAPKPYAGLPEELVPSEELRAEIEAEFAAKVTERIPVITSFFSGGFWGNKDKDSKPGDAKDGANGSAAAVSTDGAIEPAGDGAPVGDGNNSRGTVHTGASVWREKQENGQNPNQQTGGGFIDWLLGLFKN